MTRTFAILNVSRATWEEIYRRLEEAGSLDIPCCGTIDMHGIGLKMSKERSQEAPVKVRRYPPEESKEEPDRCCWCGEKEEVVMIPPRLCDERFKRGFVGPCQFMPEGPEMERMKEKILGLPESLHDEPLPYDHEGARRLRELDGRGRE